MWVGEPTSPEDAFSGNFERKLPLSSLIREDFS